MSREPLPAFSILAAACLALAAACLALGGCATSAPGGQGAPAPAPDLATYAGHLVVGRGPESVADRPVVNEPAYEESWFTPCGAAASDPAWRVRFPEHAAEYDRARDGGPLKPGQRAFVRMTARRMKDVAGQGPNVPQLVVDRLLEVRPAGEQDCSAP